MYLDTWNIGQNLIKFRVPQLTPIFSLGSFPAAAADDNSLASLYCGRLVAITGCALHKITTRELTIELPDVDNTSQIWDLHWLSRPGGYQWHSLSCLLGQLADLFSHCWVVSTDGMVPLSETLLRFSPEDNGEEPFTAADISCLTRSTARHPRIDPQPHHHTHGTPRVSPAIPPFGQCNKFCMHMV